MSIRILLLPFLLAVMPATVFADPEVGSTPRPDWSETIAVEDFPSDRSGQYQFGIAYLLTDRQILKTADGFDYVHRVAYRVVDRSGLEEAARITASFDPSKESMAFNFVRIIRDSEVFDRLADADITLLRQEEELESSLIDGSITALIQLEDVRVGDVIDYSYSGSVASRLWPDEFFHVAQIGWSVPLAQMHFRLLVPDDLAVHTRSVSTDIEPEITREDGWTSFRLRVLDPDPVRMEQNIPDDWIPFGFVAFTTMDSWTDVVDWALPIYTIDEPLPNDFTARLDAIAKRHPQPRDQAIHVLRLVQDEVRYLGIEVGLGSHVPRLPGVTLERGYGDCKDKSVLLVAALHYLGIKAVPALAALNLGHVLPSFPPSVGGFDHVIVEFDIDGQKYWVDPTLSHQGGLADNLASLGYGYVLPIRPGQAGLVELDEPFPPLPTLEVQETFEIPESGDTGMRLTAEYIYRKASADMARLRVVGQGEEALARDFLDYYAANYEGLTEARPFSISDDLDTNVVVFSAEYAVDATTFARSDLRKDLPVFATAVQDMLPRQVEATRSTPLRLPYGTNVRHIVRIVTPGRRFDLPRDTSLSVGGISYTRNFERDGDAFVMDFGLTVTDRKAELESIRAVTDLADEITEETELVVHMDAATPTSSRTAAVDTPLDPATARAIERIDQQIADKDYVSALTTLNTLVREHTEATEARGILQLKRATVLVKLGRHKAAVASFREAFTLVQPPTASSYFKYMDALRQEGDDAGTVDVMVRMLDHFPEAVDDFNMDWVSSFWRHLSQAEKTTEKDTMSLAVARALHEADVENVDEYAWLVLKSIEILGQRGEAEEASRYLPYLKDPAVLADLLTSRKTETLWGIVEDYAGEDLSTAISNYVTYTRLLANLSPDDYLALMRHVTALRIAGRYEDAARFAKLFTENWARIDAVGEDAYWFVNETAYALSDGGRGDEALELMRRLVDLGVRENDSLVSMAINRAELLVHWGRFEAALEAIDQLESLGDGYTSDYGRMWIYDAKACALHQLGRKDEARSVVEESMAPIADENPSAHTKAMLCLDEFDEAADIIVDRLQDPANNRSLIVSFSDQAEPVTMPPFLAELNRRANAVRGRSDVREAFDKVGRAISISGANGYWGDF